MYPPIPDNAQVSIILQIIIFFKKLMIKFTFLENKRKLDIAVRSDSKKKRLESYINTLFLSE